MAEEGTQGPKKRIRAGKRDIARRRSVAQKVADGTFDESKAVQSAKASLKSQGFDELVAKATL